MVLREVRGDVSLTAVSLFAGVGGFDLAMDRAGIDVVATVEIDKAARSVLARHWPDRAHFEDVTKVTADELRNAGFVPDRGVLTGGFPCQDLSVAGRRAGLAGERSGLFWEIARLAAQLRPRWLVLENVPGLLSSNGGRDFGTVLGALAELGYGWAYRILDAQFFGVAQRRRRVFIVGCLGDDGTAPGEVLALREGVRGYPAPSQTEGERVAGSLAASSGSGGLGGVGQSASAVTSRIVESPVAALTSTGVGTCGADDNQAQAGHLVPTLLTMREGKDGGGKGPLVSENQSLTLATGNGQVLIQPYVKVVRSGARDENGDLPPEVWAERDVAPTLNVMDNTGEARATVLAFSHTQGLDAQPSDDAWPTMRSEGGGHAVSVGGAVRRLTPVECERLQGFPDGWTDGQPDSRRYKQMGNAVAVPVAEWIMRRLVSCA